MAIRIELNADKERGPGHGILRIEGIAPVEPPVDLALERNQSNERFLRRGGIWQAAEAWFTLDDVGRDDDAVLIPVGPEFIDPIVSQPPSVAYRLTLATATTRRAAVMTVNRGLLGSGASATPPPDVASEQEVEAARRREDERRRADEDARRRAEAEAAATAATAAVQPIEPAVVRLEAPPRRWPLFAAGAAGLVAIGAGAAWYGCLIPGFGAAHCTAAMVTAEVTMQPPASLSCTGLAADACYEVAKQAVAGKDLELRRQLCQQAAQLGSVEANICMARMYDPATWSRADSPAAEADWETAAYWYEKAAKLGDGAGLAGAGRLLCTAANSDFEHKQGAAYLRQAIAKGGDPTLQQQLTACEARNP